MSMTPRPPIPSFIPESAPFTPEQRTWLNGLFAGCSGLQESITPLSAADAAKLLPASWRRPPRRRTRTTMAHLARSGDADRRAHEARRRPAIAAAPDGGDGAAGLRPVRLQLRGLCGALFAQIGEASEPLRAGRQRDRSHAQAASMRSSRSRRRTLCRRPRVPALAGSRAGRAAGRSRDNPVYATLVSRRRLNKPGSEKETWHVDFDLAGSRSRLCGRRQLRHHSRQRSRPWSTR